MFHWSEQDIAYMKSARAEKIPSAEIARFLGVSKGAVAGKARRLGLSGTREDAAAGRRRQAARVRGKAIIATAIQHVVSADTARENEIIKRMAKQAVSRAECPESVLPESKMLTFAQWSERGGCAWIFGDMQGIENKRWCAAPIMDGGRSWCIGHHAVVYRGGDQCTP